MWFRVTGLAHNTDTFKYSDDLYNSMATKMSRTNVRAMRIRLNVTETMILTDALDRYLQHADHDHARVARILQNRLTSMKDHRRT